MPIAFATPAYLLLAPPLLLLVWLLGRRSLAGLDAGRRRFALALRMVVVSLLCLSLAEVQWRDLTQRVEVLFVLDHSRSIPDEQTAQALEVIEAARAGMSPLGDLGKVVVFGRDASTETRLAHDRPKLTAISSAVQRDHTNLEEGLTRALEALQPDARGRIVLLSDGNGTMGDAGAALARARAAQVPVDVIPLDYAWDKELLVEKLVLPDEIKTGEPFLARVVVHATRRTRARVSLFQEGVVLQSQEVTLDPGPNVAVFQLQFDRPEFFRVRAVVESLEAGGDQLYQNNAAHGFVFARGKATVLLVHDEEDPQAEESQHLLRALEAEQIACKAVPPAQFPLDALELQAYDAIILDDIDRPSLSEAQQMAIESAVGNMGVGLIMIGGERGFGAGEWRGSPVELALPVEMDIKQEEVIPDGALTVILHSCEMADGNSMALKVCQKAVESLSAKDWFGILHFGGSGNEWAVPLIQARDKNGIKNKIGKLQPGDMPDFDGIFRLALKGLKNVNASVKHMLMLSDGDPSPPAPELLKECRDKRITVSTICYFAHGGSQGTESQNMRRIANMTGGKYYYLDDAKKLPQIFIKESQRVARSLIVNQTFKPEARTKSPVLTGFEGFPPVTGYVLTEPKPRAEVALVSPENAPVLAHWQYGVGRSLAFTSDAKPRWASAWVAWPGYQSFWAQAVRWVSKEVHGGAFQVATSVRGDRGVIALDAMTQDNELIEGLNVVARVTAPKEGAKPIDVQLVQKGAGRYEGEFPLGEVGTYNVHMMTREKGKLRHSVTTGLVSPYSDEFKRLRTDRPALAELARQGGGRLLEPDAVQKGQVDLWDRAALAERIALEERWPWVLTAALFLFLLDVALRRVAIDWDKLFARVVAAVRRAPAEAQARTMERLRERKAEVREVREEQQVRAPGAPPPPPAKFDASQQPAPGTGPVQVAGGQPAPPGPQPPAAPPGARPPAQKKSEGSMMDRLREAKKRAKQQEHTEDQGDGPEAGGGAGG